MNYANKRTPLLANIQNNAKRVQENLDAREGEHAERLEPIVKRINRRLEKKAKALEKRLKEVEDLENYAKHEKLAVDKGNAALEAFAKRNPYLFK